MLSDPRFPNDASLNCQSLDFFFVAVIRLKFLLMSKRDTGQTFSSEHWYIAKHSSTAVASKPRSHSRLWTKRYSSTWEQREKALEIRHKSQTKRFCSTGCYYAWTRNTSPIRKSLPELTGALEKLIGSQPVRRSALVSAWLWGHLRTSSPCLLRSPHTDALWERDWAGLHSQEPCMREERLQGQGSTEGTERRTTLTHNKPKFTQLGGDHIWSWYRSGYIELSSTLLNSSSSSKKQQKKPLIALTVTFQIKKQTKKTNKQYFEQN